MRVRTNLNLPLNLWTAQDSLGLALNTVATIKLRTSKGIDASGSAFDRYSTKPLYVAKKGARLKPKGGQPSRTGKSIYYARGYRQYKQESRKRSASGEGQSAEVDLVLSGQLMNNLVVLDATKDQFKIGLTKHVKSYGYHVNNKREYIGLTNDEVDILVEAIRFDLLEKLQ